MSLVLGALTALVLLATPLIVAAIAPGFVKDAGKFDLTVELFRVMFPYLICMSLTAMASGMLNAHRRFVAAAVAPILLNAALIGALGIGIWTGAEGPTVARLLSWAVLIGGAAQLVMVVVAARMIGVRIRLRRPRLTPGVKKLLWLAAPVAVSGGITQINLFVGQIIASAKPGAIAILQYADRLYQLPLGVVGVAIGVVLLPGAFARAESRQSAGGPAQPEPRAGVRAVPDGAGGDRARAHLRGTDPGALRARRLLAADDDLHGPRARRLRTGPAGLRHDPRLRTGLFRARGHAHADDLRRHLGGGERRARSRCFR